MKSTIRKQSFSFAISVCFGILFIANASLPATILGQETEIPIREYREDLKTFMKLSKDKEAQRQRNAIYNLCSLHFAIVQDQRFQQNPILQGYRVTIARRLSDYSRDVEKARMRAERKNKKSNSVAGKGKSEKSGLGLPETKVEDKTGTLIAAGKDRNDDLKNEIFMAGAQAYHSMGLLGGGPSQMFNYAGGRFAPPWDHGPELVALIENTIHPSSWRNNGGVNAIQYFQPLRVLVITASQDVHDRTLELLRKLRAANGVQIHL